MNCKAEARARNPEEGLKVVMACLRIIEKCRPEWWAMENPVGHLREYMGPSTMIFQPWEYGDPWTKRTELWGTFTPPKSYMSGGRTYLTSCPYTQGREEGNQILHTYTNRLSPLSLSLRGPNRKAMPISEPSPRLDSLRRFTRRTHERRRHAENISTPMQYLQLRPAAR